MPYFNIPDRKVISRSTDITAGAGIEQVGKMAGGVISAGMSHMYKAKKEAERELEKTERLELGVRANNALIDLDDIAESLEREHPDGKGLSEAYSEKSNQFIQSFLEGTPDKYRLEAQERLSGVVARQSISIRKRENSLLSNALASDLTESVDVIANKINSGRLNYKDGLGQISIGYEDLKQLNPTAADNFKQAATDTILSSEFQRSVRQDGYEAAINRYEAGEFDAMNPSIAQRILSAAKSKERVGITESISLAKKTLNMGIYPALDLNSEASKAEKLGLVDEANELRGLAKNKEKLIEFSSQPIQEKGRLSREASANMKAGATEDSIMYASMLDSAYRDSLSEIKNSPYDYYESRGIIQSTDDLDFNNIDTFSETMEERKVAKDQVLLHEGSDTLPLLKSHEVAVLAEIFRTSPAKQKSEYMDAISSAVGWKSFAEIAGQIAPKDRDTARIMAIASTKPDVATEIIYGQGREVDMPPRNDFVKAFQQQGYAEAGLPPSIQEDAVETAMMLFQSRYSGNKKDLSKTIASSFKDTINEPVELPNGSKMIPPIAKDGTAIPSKDLRHAFNELDIGMWISAIGDFPEDSTGLELGVDDIKEHVQFIPHGPDGYLMVLKHTGAKGYPLTRPSGEIFKVTHEELIDLVNRAPEKLSDRILGKITESLTK